MIEDAIARARALVTADPINNDYRETLCASLIAAADAARAAGDAKRRAGALDEALTQARAAAAQAPHNVHWAGLLAEVHAGIAELAAQRGDAAAASAAWRSARDSLEPLAAAGRLAAQRQALLARARAAR
jgi:hypothetical protein